jgi:cell division protein FtsQ
MKKSFLGLIVVFVLLTTYKPQFNFFKNSNLNIKKIEIENNSIVETGDIKDRLDFLYQENLFFLNIQDIENNLKNESFIDSFSIKKIYPNKIKLIIIEKTPVAILQYKKKKFFISDKGNLINFKNIKFYSDLPTVFSNGKNFYNLYSNLKNIRFPIKKIKSFYYFQSGRWDLIMHDDKIVKLPIKNYLFSLQNFMKSQSNSDFNNYKVFDYRIKDQLILN